MRQQGINKNFPEYAAEAADHQNHFTAPPVFLCALPADVARLRPLFLAEPDDHGDPHRDAQ